MTTPLTLAEYRRLDLTRPITDDPIGSTTAGRRQADANNSAIHTQPDSPVPDHVVAARRRRRTPRSETERTNRSKQP